MTTTVIISSPKPNHHKVGVRVEHLNADGNPTEYSDPMTVLDDGESTVAYVHGSARLVITEIKKDAAA